jgi:predicted DNA-binding antitoxin AbrB/MazE fold protein
MAIKALFKNGIITPLEPVEEIENGFIEVELKKLSISKKSIVKQTKGSIKLPKEIIKEIAESEEILNENF